MWADFLAEMMLTHNGLYFDILGTILTASDGPSVFNTKTRVYPCLHNFISVRLFGNTRLFLGALKL